MGLSPDDITRLRGLVADNTFTQRFDLEREIGAGGMGRVFVATEKAKGRKIAIKLLEPGRHGDSERFAKEADLLEQLEHPAIVSYIAHGVTSDGRAYLAMTWLEGEPLSDRLRRGPLPLVDVVAIGRRVAGALAYLHEREIVHRDIKPSNVFLVGKDPAAAMVIDLGIAKQLDETERLTRTGQLIGTPGYMAPEQVMGEVTIDGRVDLFALGCLLYETVTGKLPFPGVAVMEVLAHLLLHEPKPLDVLDPAIPPRLSTLVSILLAKEAKDRTVDAAATAVELAAIADALAAGDTRALATSPFERRVEATAPTQREAVTVRERRAMTRPAAPKPPDRPAPGRRWLPVVAIAAPLVAVVIVMMLFLQTPDPHAPPPAPVPVTVPVTVELPDEPSRLERTPGPLVAGKLIAAAPPVQLGSVIVAGAWCAARKQAVLVTGEGHVVGIDAGSQLASIAKLPFGRFYYAALACLPAGRILVATHEHTFRIDGDVVTPTGNPLRAATTTTPGKLEHPLDGVAVGRTARWMTRDGIWEWDGEQARHVRAARCTDRYSRISPDGERVACVQKGQLHVDTPAALEPGPTVGTSAGSLRWSADGKAVYAGAPVQRWRGGASRPELVAKGSEPIEVGRWLVTREPDGRMGRHPLVPGRGPALAESIAIGAEFSPKAAMPGAVVLAFGVEAVRVLPIEAAALALEPERHFATITKLVFARDGKRVLSFSTADGRLIWHSLAAGTPQPFAVDTNRRPPGPMLALPDGAVVYARSGKTLAGFDREGKPLAIELDTTGRTLAVIAKTGELVAASEDGIELVNLETRKLEPWKQTTTTTAKAPPTTTKLPAFTDIQIDHERRYALVKYGTSTGRLIDLATARTLVDLPPKTVNSAALVVGDDGAPTVVIADAKGRVFAIRTGRVEPIFAFGDKTHARVFAAPGRRRIAIAHDREVVVYDLDSRAELLRHEAARSFTVEWNPAGTQLAIAAGTEIRVFDVP